MYQLSLRFLGLAQQVKERIEISDLVKEELEELATMTGERSQFAMPENNRPIYVYRAEGEDDIRNSLSIGQYTYFHCIAIGKAIHAFFPESQVDGIIEKEGFVIKTVG